MVPLDYGQKNGPTIPIQLVKIHDTRQSKPLGSLLVNPGGPGGSGVLLALSLAASIDDSVLARYDIIGFDPRGVSLSSPVKCLTATQTDAQLAADYDVRTAAGLAAAKALVTTFRTACQDKYGSTITAYNTLNTARDMDLIRQAVGDSAMNYLGFSYGTELGGVYAHLFPKLVQTMVLDGAVDPATENNPISSDEVQIKGFEEAFGQYAAGCSKRSTCKGISDPEATVEQLEKSLDASPITYTDTSSTRKANGGIVLDAVISALYSQSQWPTLDTALTEALAGNAKGLFGLTDSYAERDSSGNYSNLLDMLQVVSCNDTASAPTDAQVQATAKRWATEYPLFGLSNAQSLLSCQGWPTPRTPPPSPTATTAAAPILVLGNINDPATPYVGSENLVKTLGGRARLLTWDGQGHTSYGESDCIDSKVNSYLTTGTLPAAGTTCQ